VFDLGFLPLCSVMRRGGGRGRGRGIHLAQFLPPFAPPRSCGGPRDLYFRFLAPPSGSPPDVSSARSGFHSRSPNTSARARVRDRRQEREEGCTLTIGPKRDLFVDASRVRGHT